MKKSLFLIFVSFLSLTFFSNTKSNAENFIIAKVGQKIITNFDVKNKILTSLIISGSEINQANIDKLKKVTLENLIILRLKEIQLETFNFNVDKRRIVAFIEQVSNDNTNNLKKKFKNYNLNYNFFENEIETEMRWRQFIFQNYSKKNIIDEKILDNEINKILNSRSSAKKEVNLSEIVINKNNKISDKDIISNIFKEIEINGFENTAVKFSISSSSLENGKLGWINIKTLSKKISDIVQKMNVNQISDPIIENENILFLKLNDIRTANDEIDREKLKQNLIIQKQDEIFKLYSNSHLSKLRNKNLIQYK